MPAVAVIGAGLMGCGIAQVAAVAGYDVVLQDVLPAQLGRALDESGVASVEDVDTACRLGFGHAMGPLQTMDLTGVDVFVNAARNIYADTADPKFCPPELSVRMATAGDLGRKAGRGWYEY